VLAGCTTYVEHRSPRTVYSPPPPVVAAQPPPAAVYSPPPAEARVVVTGPDSPVVVIQAETDFYEPLSPHGEWVVVGSYGRCWRPTRVEAGWRPYCDGHWQRTDAGWYWASAEPWGWATYHYGRWDFSAEFGWFWVPHTLWAPAWVSWRQGAGYVGWAPLPPSARIGSRGIVEVRETAFAPRGFVFVSEQRLLEPVRPSTVIVNNTTVINQTVNITKIQVVNKTVIAEGPRPEIIERRSGRKIEAVPVRELRRRDETEVVARQRNIPSIPRENVQTPARTSPSPGTTVPARERRQLQNPAEAKSLSQPQTTRNDVRKPADQNPATNLVRPGLEKSARNEGRPESNGGKTTVIPADGKPKNEPAARPGTNVHPGQTGPGGNPSESGHTPQPANREVRSLDESKSSTQPARTDAAKSLGNVRQRELDRVKVKPGTEQPTAPKISPTPATNSNSEADKRKIPAKDKPAAVERGGKTQKKKEPNKKGEEPEPRPPPASPRTP